MSLLMDNNTNEVVKWQAARGDDAYHGSQRVLCGRHIGCDVIMILQTLTVMDDVRPFVSLSLSSLLQTRNIKHLATLAPSIITKKLAKKRHPPCLSTRWKIKMCLSG